jgi:hypothetical protein
MRYWLIDLPARLVDRAAYLYLLVLAAMTVIALLTAALWLLAVLLGFPLP